MWYPVKTPWLIKKLYPSYTWSINTDEKVIYLTFDDGPHAVATPFVLEQLKQFAAKATFFCIGKNVVAHPDVYRRLLEEGHTTANHTQHHLRGTKTKDADYLNDIIEAARYIDSPLFRPPYGRITRFQAKAVMKAALSSLPSRIIMWDVLSGDFDTKITAHQCARNVIQFARKGSVVVFHDSEKALPRLTEALPRVLEHFSQKGFCFRPIPL